MLAAVPSQLNRIDFKDPAGASQGNYITNKLIPLKRLLELQNGIVLETLI